MLKIITELGPLLVFFIGYRIGGLVSAAIYTAVATALAVTIDFYFRKQINKMHLASCLLLFISATLTIYSGNADIIKMKPTFLYLVFAVVFIVSRAFNKPVVKMMLGEQIKLNNDNCWHVLNFRFAFFFTIMAIANEVIWRNFPEEFWVNYKIFAILPINIAFIFMQLPYIMKHQVSDIKQ